MKNKAIKSIYILEFTYKDVIGGRYINASNADIEVDNGGAEGFLNAHYKMTWSSNSHRVSKDYRRVLNCLRGGFKHITIYSENGIIRQVDEVISPL